MDQQMVLEKLEQSWSAFRQSYAGLSAAQMTAPGVTEGWSVKDIIAHVSEWEVEALKHLPRILLGDRPPRYSDQYGGLDAFNAQATSRQRTLSLAEILRRQEDTHQRLLTYLQSVPAELYASETRFRRRLRLDTYGHYLIHMRAILAWREQNA